MSTFIQKDILTDEEIEYILSLPEVLEAKKKIDSKVNGSVYFDVNLTSEIRDKICEKFGLKSSLQTLPMRWIKGDTLPHIDHGIKNFNNTHLMYLTDSEGELILKEEVYPITKGSSYIFNEGVHHETRNTGSIPRLLLGPMSEEGFAVGAATTISRPGGTTVYFRYSSGSGIEYSVNDQITWNGTSWPVSIENSTGSGMLIVEFVTDITVQSDIIFLNCISDNIQFGSTSLNNDGSRRKIIVDNAADYPGFINNFDGSVGYNSIHVFNLEIEAINGSTINSDSGWLCQYSFGYSRSDNLIINCHSSGALDFDNNGGIVGANAGSGPGASLTIIGCSNSGVIDSPRSGGIAGPYSGDNNGNLIIKSCWNTGDILGSLGGGIAGYAVGSSSGECLIENCYSTGNMTGSFRCGGIVGANAGSTNGSITINNCYTTGSVSTDQAGGIYGAFQDPNVTCTITNCYTTGNISGDLGGGICGYIFGSATSLSLTIQNCYTTGLVTTPSSDGFIIGGQAGENIPGKSSNCYSEAFHSSSGWNTSNANSVLTGEPSSQPGVGSTWVSTGTSQPYEIFNMGYTPYSTTNISGSNLVRTASATVSAGTSTSSAIVPGLSYSILQVGSGTITINSTTGVISTTSSTPPATYTIYIRNTGSYNITTYTLTVTAGVTPSPPIPSGFYLFSNVITPKTITVKVPAATPNNPFGFTVTQTPYRPNLPISWR